MISLNPKDWLLLGMAVVIAGMLTAVVYKEHQYNSVVAEYATYKREQSEALAKAEREARLKLEEQSSASREIEEAYVRGLAVTSNSLDAALKRVREYKRATSVGGGTETGSASCGANDASPSQLSVADREFLVRLGAEADGLANQVNSLQSYIKAITK